MLLALPVVSALRNHVGKVPDRILDPVVRRITEPVLTRLIRRVAYTEGRDEMHAASSAWSINETAMRTKIGFLHALKLFDAYDVLPSITASTLVLSGGKDFLTPREHAEDIVSGIAGAEHIHYPRNGHMLLHEVFDSVTNALDMFVSFAGPASLHAADAR